MNTDESRRDEMKADDMELLQQYAKRGSEDAFAVLVSRHVHLVYSVALRQTGDPHSAEEITQAVFIILARKAKSLGDKTILPGWLCRTARNVAANALTVQRRRQRREQEAVMETILNEPATDETWKRIAPLLDAALGGLGGKDHDAIVLRFFENRELKQVGAALGVSEDAAKKRVRRALEKLRRFFLRRGVDSTAAAIGETISANSIQAAPAALAKTVAGVALAKGATASVSTLTLIKGALKIMAWTKTKTAIVAGAAILLAVGATTVTVKAAHHVAVARFKRQIAPGSILNNPFNRVVENRQNRRLIQKLRAEVWPAEKQATEEKIKTRQRVNNTKNAVTIDLRSYINAKLTEGPIGPAGNEGNNFAEVPSGVHIFGGVPFDVGGVVYLTGGWMRHFKKDFPLKIQGIRIGRRCSKIYLLHGAALISFNDRGKTVAKLVLHYSDGTTAELDINAGRQVIDEWAPLFQTGVNPLNLQTAPDTVVAWTGSNPEIRREQPDESLVLCRTTFDNPKPDVELVSIDYVSTDTATVPFLLGLTVE